MMRVRLMAAVAGLGLVASVAGAQGVAPAESKEVIANGGVVHEMLAAPVIGQPYSAVVMHGTVQKLADGTTVSHKGHHSAARDAQGRVRVEMRMEAGKNGEADTVTVFVIDPVAHALTTWVTGPKVVNKTASVVKLQTTKREGPIRTVPARAAAESGRPQPIVTTEDLGTETLDGVPVSVVKTTTIVPAGRSG